MESYFRKNGQKRLLWDDIWKQLNEVREEKPCAATGEKAHRQRKEQVQSPYDRNVLAGSKNQDASVIGSEWGKRRVWRHEMGDGTRDPITEGLCALLSDLGFNSESNKRLMDVWEQEVIWCDLQFRKTTLAVLWRRDGGEAEAGILVKMWPWRPGGRWR